MALMLLPESLSAQTITFVDAITLQPLDGATLTSDPPGVSAIVDGKGRARLDAFKGRKAVLVSHVGYRAIVLSPDTVAGAIVRMQRQVIGLEEFVVSASRFEEKRRDVPEQVDIIKRREISFLDQQTTPDLLQNSGALFVQRSQMGGGSPVIRGFEASRVLLVVDGVRMNNAIYRGGHLQDLMTVDQNAIERIEVVSGPGSVVYGSDALGGVVHLMTRAPRFRDTTGVSVHGGAFLRMSTANEEKTGSATIEIGGRRLASLTTITASDFGDLRMGGERDARYGSWGLKPFIVHTTNGTDSVLLNAVPLVQSPTGYKQMDVLQKLRLRIGRHMVHQVNTQLSTSSDVPRYDRLSEYMTDSLGSYVPAQSEWYYGPQKRMLLAYTLELDSMTGFFDRGRITPSYQAIEQSRHSRSFGSSRLGHRTERVRVLGFNVDLEKSLGKHELRYGLEAYANTVASDAYREHIRTGEVTYLTTRYPNGGSTMNSYAAYISHTIELNEQVVLSGGLRYSWIGLTADFADDRGYQFLNGRYTQANGALNWRAGLVYSPGHDWRFTALASTGFRAPNVDDMAKVFDSTPGTVVVPNTNLEPEHTTNFEVGVSRTMTDKLFVESHGFYTLYTNALTMGAYTFNGQDSIVYDGTMSRVTALTNSKEAYLYGAQGQLILEISKRMSVRGGITYTFGRVSTDSTDRPLDHIPPVYGRGGVQWGAKRVQAEAYVLFNGWKRLKDTDTQPGSEDNLQYATIDGTPSWWTLNLRGSYAINRSLTVQAGLENMLDTHYRTFASGVSAPGRNLQLSLRVQW
ncbi:MAG: TonB-dependent receptor [Flavobacteriales bacterium]|nr:TonB-dependent receptor [Flavobacteriales bacterium]